MKRDVDFLFEIGALRLIPRQWQRFHLYNVQNLAEHHFRVTWLALIIAAREGGDTSAEKITKMALVHDIAESRTGDADYLARQYVIRNEELGIKDMLAGTPLADEFVALWQEYEAKESMEAKIVKDADNLDVDMELREQSNNGHSLGADWLDSRDHVRTTKLYTKTAKELYDAIKTADPNGWHRTSRRNRFNGGDWKKKQK